MNWGLALAMGAGVVEIVLKSNVVLVKHEDPGLWKGKPRLTLITGSQCSVCRDVSPSLHDLEPGMVQVVVRQTSAGRPLA